MPGTAKLTNEKPIDHKENFPKEPNHSKRIKKKIVIMPGLLSDYLVLSDDIVLLSPEYAKKLIEMP